MKTEPAELYTAITEDGSLSLVSGEYLQLYHNRSGAYSEALRDYSNVAQAVLRTAFGGHVPSPVNVLDCCFGLGYNSFVLAQELPAGVDLNVTGIEFDPTVMTFVPKVLAQSCFAGLRAAGFNKEVRHKLGTFSKTVIDCPGRASTMSFDLVESDLRQYWLNHDHDSDLHLVLHDPFSPKKMPEMWTIDLFARYQKALVDGGMVITYSSAPAIRGAFLDLGFKVYKTPLVGGMWGGTLAVKGDWLEAPMSRGELSETVFPLGNRESVRLSKSSRVPFRDPHLTALRDEIVSNHLEEQVAFRRAAGGRD